MEQTLVVQLGRTLVAMSLEFERRLGDGPSLAMWLNVLLLVDDAGTDKKTLAARSHLARPALAMLLKTLQRHQWIELEGDVVVLTSRTLAIRAKALETLTSVEREHYSLHALPNYPMAFPHRGGTPTGA